MQGAYYQEAMGLKSLKMLTLSRCIGRTKLYSPGQYLHPFQCRIVPSMEIRLHSRPFLARYKRCTNARCILSRSYGLEEFKNVNTFSVQKAHKAVMACQYLRPLHRRKVPWMVIRVHSRPFLARYEGCTNARCILSRSYGLEEFKNVNPFSRCKRRTKLYSPTYIYVPCSAVNCREWIFSYIRHHS